MKKVILLTGASSRLGIPLTRAFLNKNWIVYAGLRDTSSSKDLKTLKKKYSNLQLVKLDITSDINCKDVVSAIVKKHGRIDYIVNNAGVTKAGPSLEFSPDEYTQMFDVNMLGALRVCVAAVPVMRKQKNGGRIINITSLNGLVSLPNFGMYSASKFALEAFTSALRAELSDTKVLITAVAPGAIKTVNKAQSQLPHKPMREKFKILDLILKMSTEDEVSQKVVAILQSPRPPARVVVGQDAHITILLNKYLPSFIWDKLLIFLWQK